MARIFQAVLLVGLMASAVAQRSAGSYGQGGQGGQGGGGMGGYGGGGLYRGGGGAIRANAEPMAPRPEDDDPQTLWETKSAILTPGDRVEYKLKMEAGETVMAGVTSDAFDPALAITDPKGKILAQNDDRAEGDQSPFLVFRVTDAGTYTLKVLSYHSVSGGKFQIMMRQFKSVDVSPGKREYPYVPLVEQANRGTRLMIRLSAKKDRIYDIREVAGKAARYWNTLQFFTIIGPTGVAANDSLTVQMNGAYTVFQALRDGDYYLEYAPSSSPIVETNIRELTADTMKATDEKVLDLLPGDLAIVDFPVKNNQIVHTVFSGKHYSYEMTGPSTANSGQSGGDELYGNSRFMTHFKLNVQSDGDVVRVFHGDGNVRIALRENGGLPEKVVIRNSESLPSWDPAKTIDGVLDIGEAKLFLINSTKSELMRVFASASHFLPRLDIFELDGSIANSLFDRSTRTATDDLYFPDPKPFIVRLSCEGNGGSGEYKMKREELTTTPYRLGSVQSIKLDGDNFGLYSVDLEAGKRYELMTDHTELWLRADLLDDDGQFLSSNAMTFQTVIVQYFTPTRSGRHRLWLRGTPGVRNFKLSLHKDPVLGSG